MSQSLSGRLSGWWPCLSPSSTQTPWTVGSGDYPPLVEEQDFHLCTQAIQQLWYVVEDFVNKGEVTVLQNSPLKFQFSNSLDEEGYYTFWNCGVTSKTKEGVVIVPKKHTSPNNPCNIPELPPNGSSDISEFSNNTEQFYEVISYSQDSIQKYANLLRKQLELQQQDENQSIVENQIKIVAEFVSHLLGGNVDEYQVGSLWGWHCQLMQDRKQSIVLDISELKFGTSFHRGTLFVILWHSLGLEAMVSLRPPLDEGDHSYPKARLVAQSHKIDSDGNAKKIILEVDLMSNPGKAEETQNAFVSITQKTLFNPSADGDPNALKKESSPYNKSFKDTVKKLIVWGRAITKRFRQDGPCVDFLMEGYDKIEEETEEKLPRLSTQVYKLQKIKAQDVKLQDILGQGGFGKVYRANYFGAKVAVKFLLCTSNNDTDKKIREELKNELFMLGWLTHPSIVSLIGVMVPEDESSNNYGIVMEFLERKSLYDIIHNQDVQLPLFRRLHIVLNACQAVYFLHSVEVEHRDISSRNILVDQAYRGKLSDFGLSKTREQIESADSNNKTYQPGNVFYMPFEVLAGEDMQQINGKSVDSFSIGVVLWETATMQIPWDGVTSAAIFVKVGILKQKLELSEQTIPNEKLRKLIGECWEENPENRPEFHKICASLGEIVNEIFTEYKQFGQRTNV